MIAMTGNKGGTMPPNPHTIHVTINYFSLSIPYRAMPGLTKGITIYHTYN
jgi:hypothetical protein